MSSIPWSTVRNAIQSWITIGSGLAGDHVVWAGQRDADGNLMPRPAGMYIALRLTLLKWNGFSDWKAYELDTNTNVLTQHVRGPRVAMLTATCFQGVPTGGTGQPSDTSAMAVLNEAMAATGLDPVVAGLVAAGVGLGNIASINVAGGTIQDVKFEERAIVQVQINLASDIAYAFPAGQGWIDIVNASGDSPGDLSTVSVHVDGSGA